MCATVCEGQALVGDAIDADAKTRAQQKHIDEAQQAAPKPHKVNNCTHPKNNISDKYNVRNGS